MCVLVVVDGRWRENGRVGMRGHSCDIVGVRVWMQGRRRDRVRYVIHYLIGLCIVRFHVQRFKPHTCVVIEGFEALEIMHLLLSLSSS